MLPNSAGGSGAGGQGRGLEENHRIFNSGDFIMILNLEALLSFPLEPPVHERKQCIISGYLGVFRSMSAIYIN